MPTATTTDGTARALYDAGQFTDALEAAKTEGDLVLQAWCNYRLKNYDEARRCATEAQTNDQPGAGDVLRYIAAYVDKDLDVIRELALSGHTGHQPNDLNALLIGLRATEEELLTLAEVRARLEHWRDETGVSVANLFHNGARIFLDRQRGSEDLATALDLINIALAKYEAEGDNWHHRGAASFWKSKIVEVFDGRESALVPAEESARFWAEQCIRAPTENFRNRFQGSLDRLVELRS